MGHTLLCVLLLPACLAMMASCTPAAGAADAVAPASDAASAPACPPPTTIISNPVKPTIIPCFEP